MAISVKAEMHVIILHTARKFVTHTDNKNLNVLIELSTYVLSFCMYIDILMEATSWQSCVQVVITIPPYGRLSAPSLSLD